MKYRAIIKISFDEIRDLLDIPDDIEITDYFKVVDEERVLKVGVISNNRGILYEVPRYSQLPYINYNRLKERLEDGRRVDKKSK